MNRTEDRVSLSLQNWLGLVGIIVVVTGGVIGFMESRFGELDDTIKQQHEKIYELDRRLTTREANAFTSQQANELSTAVTRLSTEMFAAQSALRKYEENEARRSFDVLKEVQELRKEIEEARK